MTSVFGMTNMPTERHYWTFGIVTGTVCVPFFILIGSLNTNRGMQFWREETVAFFGHIGRFLAWLGRCGRSRHDNDSTSDTLVDRPGHRAAAPQMSSIDDNRTTRLRRWSTAQDPDQSKESVGLKSLDVQTAHIRRPLFGRSRSSRIAEMWTAESMRRTISV